MTSWLELTIEVDGKVVLTETVTGEDLEVQVMRHQALTNKAHDAGRHWTLTITDPDGVLPPMRISNRPLGMQQPMVASAEVIDEDLARRAQFLNEGGAGD